MRTLRFNVKSQELDIEPDQDAKPLTSFNNVKMDFTFSRDWNDLSKIAVFKSSDYVKCQCLDNDSCQIPEEVSHESKIKLSIAGNASNTFLLTNSVTILLGKEETDANITIHH